MIAFSKLRSIPVIGQRMIVVHDLMAYDGTFESMSAGNNGRFVLHTNEHLVVFPPSALVQLCT